VAHTWGVQWTSTIAGQSGFLGLVHRWVIW